MTRKATKPEGTPREKLEDLLRTKATVTPEEILATGADDFGSRNTIYGSCKSGQIENFRAGNRYKIVTAPLRRKLGMEAA